MKLLIGILDYGAGNCTSLRNAISSLRYHTRIIRHPEDLEGIDFLFIPGVGAFPSAMAALDTLNMIEPIKVFATRGKPLMGICLGMQLLADKSYEQGETEGLGLITGVVQHITTPNWHIGWNQLCATGEDMIAAPSEGKDFYYNHSYEYKTADKYIVASSHLQRSMVSIIRKDNICGLQFHPEKSQDAGLSLLENAIRELSHA